MTPGAYLERLTTAQPLFRLLYKEAVGVLPPARAGACQSEPLFCGLSVKDLAARMGWSHSSTREELRRLIAHGWVTGARKKTLGHRVGAEIALLADVAVEEATGEERVVSRVVLALDEKSSDLPAVGRGLARRFEL